MFKMQRYGLADIAPVAAQRRTTRVNNKLQTHRIGLLPSAQVDVTVAGTDVLNRGSVWGIFDEVGVLDAGDEVINVDGPTARLSTLALRLALDEWDRVVVLDSARSQVFNRIAAGGHFPDFETLAAWLVGPGSNLKTWAVALRAKTPDDYAAVLRASEHFRRILLVCDETHKLCRLPGVREPLELVALTGAHYGDGAGVGLFMVSQRPGSVPINIRSQAERVICFRQREPRDIAWLAEWSGDEEWAASVTGLADHAWTQYPPTSTVKKGSQDAQVATLDRVRSGNGGGAGDHRAVVPQAEQGERGRLPSEHRIGGA